MDLRDDESSSSFVFLPCWLWCHNTPYIFVLGIKFATLTEVEYEFCGWHLICNSIASAKSMSE